MERNNKIKRRAFLANLLFAAGTVSVASLGYSAVAPNTEQNVLPAPATPQPNRNQGGKARRKGNRRPAPAS